MAVQAVTAADFEMASSSIAMSFTFCFTNPKTQREREREISLGLVFVVYLEGRIGGLLYFSCARCNCYGIPLYHIYWYSVLTTISCLDH